MEALGQSFEEMRDSAGQSLGRLNDLANNARNQEREVVEQDFTDDEFFAGAPDLTAEFDKAASGSAVEREHELTATPPQNAPPPQTMKP